MGRRWPECLITSIDLGRTEGCSSLILTLWILATEISYSGVISVLFILKMVLHFMLTRRLRPGIPDDRSLYGPIFQCGWGFPIDRLHVYLISYRTWLTMTDYDEAGDSFVTSMLIVVVGGSREHVLMSRTTETSCLISPYTSFYYSLLNCPLRLASRCPESFILSFEL